jgi:hypothetical protein
MQLTMTTGMRWSGQNGVRYIVIFGFKPEMYKVFRRYNPRNVAPYIYRETVAEANSN